MRLGMANWRVQLDVTVRLNIWLAAYECGGLLIQNQSLRARTKCADTSVSGIFCLKTPHLAKQVPGTISLLFSVLPATAVACSCSELPAEDARAYGGAAW